MKEEEHGPLDKVLGHTRKLFARKVELGVLLAEVFGKLPTNEANRKMDEQVKPRTVMAQKKKEIEIEKKNTSCFYLDAEVVAFLVHVKNLHT